MPSTSPSQQRLMGMAYAYQKGELDISKYDKTFQKQIKQITKMDPKKLREFAATKHEKLAQREYTRKDKILIGAGVATGAVGVSMMPAAYAMSRAAKAMSKQNYPEAVVSYLEGGRAFGKSIPGAITGKFLSRVEDGRDLISAGKGKFFDKVLDKIGPKDRFSNQHYINFLHSNSKRGKDFWVGTEAYGRSRGQFETASKQIHEQVKAVKRLDKDPTKAVAKAFESGVLTDVDKARIVTVPTYKQTGPQTRDVALNQAYRKYRSDSQTVKQFDDAIAKEQNKGVSMYEAMRRVGKNNPELAPVFKRTALDKVPGDYYRKYTKSLTAGSGGLALIGGVGTTHKVREDKK